MTELVRDMMPIAFGQLHMSPDHFYAMTHREFTAAEKGMRRLESIRAQVHAWCAGNLIALHVKGRAKGKRIVEDMVEAAAEWFGFGKDKSKTVNVKDMTPDAAKAAAADMVAIARMKRERKEARGSADS